MQRIKKQLILLVRELVLLIKLVLLGQKLVLSVVPRKCYANDSIITFLPTTDNYIDDDDLTNCQTLVKMRSKRAKEKEKDKGKGVLVEEEPEKPVKLKRRDQGLAQIESDAELAQRLHEEELAEQDVIDLHRLVNERYEITSPEGYDLLLWGDLKTLFEPNEEDEIWKNQQDYNLISWRLFDSCGVHVLLMNTGVAIHMMIEKKYPLTQEMLSGMLNRRLEVDY
ncbi:hypothetical protein Tco_0808988 [Tanacetum coccineum]